MSYPEYYGDIESTTISKEKIAINKTEPMAVLINQAKVALFEANANYERLIECLAGDLSKKDAPKMELNCLNDEMATVVNEAIKCVELSKRLTQLLIVV